MYNFIYGVNEIQFSQVSERSADFANKLLDDSSRNSIIWGRLDLSSDQPSLGPLVLGLMFTLMPLAFLVVGLRIYANRATPGIGLGWEDYFIIPCIVTSIHPLVLNGD
jgi:hypothetical protein